MYGIFTYKTVCFLVQMLANIPAPWSIWAWETWGNNRKKCEIQEIPEIHGLVGKVIEVYWTSSV